MESIAVLAHNVRDLALAIEHEESHVCSGGLSQAKVTCSNLLAFIQQRPHTLGSSIVRDIS